jgi:basic membrane protein A
MKNKFILTTTILFLITSFLFTGCKPADQNDEKSSDDSEEVLVKVGMVTDSGTIDDKSFNQGTWEGIEQYKEENGKIETKYLKPQGVDTSDYEKAITTLIDSKYDLIITPGYMFEEAISNVSKDFEDTSFVLIDGLVEDADNVVSVNFASEQSGFLAGISASLSSKTGKVGFIGGQEIPSVQAFEFGYEAGIKYAKDNLDSETELSYSEYADSFNDVAKGKTLASTMYTNDVDIIFHAAGGVGTGIITEAKERALKGEEVYVIGVDRDQYSEGEYEDGKSVVLTSAIKKVDTAAYMFIDDKVNEQFKGGESVTITIKDGGVGLPEENPNLSEDVLTEIDNVTEKLIADEITVPQTEEELEEYLK